jgi:RimJ/RimL family protein N-acetyltransferase
VTVRLRRPGAEPEPVPEGYPRELEHRLRLLDGRRVFLRPILPSDADELARAVAAADPETLRRRFLGGSPPRTPAEFEHLVRVDYRRRSAVVALAEDGHGVGIARYEALGDTDTAEIAVAVDPEWRHVGLATALLRQLAAGAVAHGIHRFAAEFFADNLDVTDLLEEADAPFRNVAEGAGVVSVELSLPEQLEPE